MDKRRRGWGESFVRVGPEEGVRDGTLTRARDDDGAER